MKDFLKAIIWTGIFSLPLVVLITIDGLFFPFITGKNFTFRILVTIIFAAWVLLALLEAKYRPKFSYLLYSLGGLLAVMFLANIFGVHPHSSFWSNYERMDGYITLVHLSMLFLVMGTMMRQQIMWYIFWNISFAIAVFVGFKGVQEFAETSTRISSSLGNPIYLAIYMLFHMFMALFYLVRSKELWIKILFTLLFIFFGYILLLTGTRGAALGLLVGFSTTVIYVALFGARHPQFRKVAFSLVAILLVAVGSFYTFRGSDFVQNTGVLSRIANIDLRSDLEVRGTIWQMAFTGAMERPVLGWGQSNYNFVFNEFYDPFLFVQEQWFDRVHNIILDWLIAGGVLGLLAYVSLFGVALYYLLRARGKAEDEEDAFNVLEQGIILGLLVAYFVHNLSVFDNIISYVFFIAVLAMIYARTSIRWDKIENFRIQRQTVTQVIAPIVLVVTCTTIYFINIPSLQASADLLQAIQNARIAEQTQTVEQKRERYDASLDLFEQALSRNGFGQQEIVEQLLQISSRAVNDTTIASPQRDAFRDLSDRQIRNLIQFKPGDARVHVFAGNFYRSVGDLGLSEDQFARARELSPLKQSIIMQQGATALNKGDTEEAKSFFKEALELDERHHEARSLYAALLLAKGDMEAANNVLYVDIAKRTVSNYRFASDRHAAAVLQAFTNRKPTEEEVAESSKVIEINRAIEQLANNNFLVNLLDQSEVYEILVMLYEIRVAQQFEVPQEWVSLAFAYYQNQDNETAIEVLREAARIIPGLQERTACYIRNIESGNEPGEGC